MPRTRSARAARKLPPVIEIPDYTGETVTIHGERIAFVDVHHSETDNPCEDCDGMGHIYSLSHRHINHKSLNEVLAILREDPDAVPLSYYEHGQCRWSVAGDRGNCPDWRWDGVDFAGVWVPDDCVRESVPQGAEYALIEAPARRCYSCETPYPAGTTFTEPVEDVLGGDVLGECETCGEWTAVEEYARKVSPPARREWFREQAASACEEYTAWANGEVYGYNVEVYELRRAPNSAPYDERSDYRHETPIYEDSCGGFIGWEYFEQELRDVVKHAAEDTFSTEAII